VRLRRRKQANCLAFIKASFALERAKHMIPNEQRIAKISVGFIRGGGMVPAMHLGRAEYFVQYTMPKINVGMLK
jgi:hypothetical protein